MRNFGLNPAYGPNMSDALPSTMRVSRCGTDIGGAPTLALPYTFAACFCTTSGSSVRRNSPDTGNPPYPRISGMPDFCSRWSAPPPAPTKTNFAAMRCVERPISLRTSRTQPSDTVERVIFRTWCDGSNSTPAISSSSKSWRVSDPKSTSEPAAEYVAAIGWSFLRPGMSAGAHCRICAGSSENSMPAKSGWSLSASQRFRMYSTLSAPQTNEMCGVGLMKFEGSGSAPVSTRWAQNCRDTWNCSLTVTAFAISTRPSGSSGV